MPLATDAGRRRVASHAPPQPPSPLRRVASAPTRAANANANANAASSGTPPRPNAASSRGANDRAATPPPRGTPPLAPGRYRSPGGTGAQSGASAAGTRHRSPVQNGGEQGGPSSHAGSRTSSQARSPRDQRPEHRSDHQPPDRTSSRRSAAGLVGDRAIPSEHNSSPRASRHQVALRLEPSTGWDALGSCPALPVSRDPQLARQQPQGQPASGGTDPRTKDCISAVLPCVPRVSHRCLLVPGVSVPNGGDVVPNGGEVVPL